MGIVMKNQREENLRKVNLRKVNLRKEILTDENLTEDTKSGVKNPVQDIGSDREIMSARKLGAEGRDQQKISVLQRQYDLQNPEIALELYEKLILQQAYFETELGKRFLKGLLHKAIHSETYLNNDSTLSGRFYSKNRRRLKNTISHKKYGKKDDHSTSVTVRGIQEIELNGEVRSRIKKNKKSLNKSKKKFLFCSLFVVLCSIFLYNGYELVRYEVLSYRSEKKIEDLVDSILIPVDREVVSIQGQEEHFANQSKPNVTDEKQILHQYSALYERNPDLIGWIHIEGTVINYPVMQNKEKEEFYLLRDFDKEKDINGLPFMDVRCDASKDANLILYGHNMKNGSMFSALMNYVEEEYYREHPVIQFDTIYEEGIYDIIAVFQTRVAYQDEIAFRYYDFVEPINESNFNEYLANISDLSYYNTYQTVSYGDQLLTLSTCDRSIEDGRLVVVARKRRSN